MDFNSIIDDINSREDFLKFLNELWRDMEQRNEEWEM